MNGEKVIVGAIIVIAILISLMVFVVGSMVAQKNKYQNYHYY